MKELVLFNQEHVASIREVQRNPSKALRHITRVVRGTKTLGFFLASDEFDGLLEDLEALGSRSFKARVRAARRAFRAKSVTHASLAEMASRYGV